MSSKVIVSLTDQRRRFLAFLERRVHDRAAAEDILQTAYTRAILQADTLKDEDSANAWFFRILRNTLTDYYRHHKVEARAIVSWQPEMEPQTSAPDLVPPNTCGCVGDALDEIHPAYREILHKVDLAEVPLKSFAHQAGITAGNAAVRAHRARTAVRRQLLNRCGSCAQTNCHDCTCRPNSVRH